MATGKWISIPIVEAESNRVVGGFCATQEAISPSELAALAQLKRLRTEAEAIKERLQAGAGADEESLTERLAALRQEAAIWRKKREEATLAKHQALGHVTLSVQSF